MKNYLTLISFCLVLLSCEDMDTVIDLEIPPHKPVLVLNGLLDPESSVKVVVSHSVGAFSEGVPSYIQDANVILYKDGEKIGSLLPDFTELTYVYYTNRRNENDSLPMYYYTDLENEGNLIGDYIPEKGALYRIEVNHPDYNPISAETYIPVDIDIEYSVDTVSSENNIELEFSFDDNPIEQNYYRLQIFTSCIKKWVDDYGYLNEYGFGNYTEFRSNDPSFPGGIPFDGYTFEGDDVVFDDALFNGQQKTILLDIQTDNKSSECDTIFMVFSTFSDDTYSYYNSLDDHSDKGEQGIFGGEVIPVYSNVQDGLGALISVNPQRIIIRERP
jgi:hypothetical protein